MAYKVGQPTTRSRRIPTPPLLTGHMSVRNEPSGSFTDTPGGPPTNLANGTQITVSEGHQWPASRFKGKWVADSGGNFFTQKSYATVLPSYGNLSKTVHPFADVPAIFRVSSFSGPVYAVNPLASGFGWATHTHSSEDELDEYGATAIARCKPTNSVADVATALGELLREGLPALPGIHTWRHRTDAGRKAGDEYLNAVFGWLPLTRDVKGVMSGVSNAGRILKQYERDAGKQVRRQYHFPTERTSHDTVLSDNWTPYMSPGNTDIASLFSGRLIQTDFRLVDRWFSGAFTYWLPTGYDSRSRLLRQMYLADKVFGTRLDPETLWNLAPWSWAIDWFSNTGDVISNVQDWILNGLVMRYGYMMETSITKTIYTYESTGSKPDPIAVLPMQFVTETKMRRKANPFGFGVSWSGLSPQQLAIVAALGLTHS